MANDVRSKKVGRIEFGIYCLIYLASVVLLVWAFFAPGIMEKIGVSFQSDIYGVLFKIIWASSLPAVLALSYWANRSGDGNDFLYRHISINFPINVVLVLFYFIADLAIYLLFFFDPSNLDAARPYGKASFSLDVAVFALYIFMSWKFMKIASKRG